MPNILIISFSDIDKDPRVTRQIDLLSNKYDLDVIGFADSKSKYESLIPLKKVKNSFFRKTILAASLKFHMDDWYYWSQKYVKEAEIKLKGKLYDLIIANDLSSLPLAFNIKTNRTKIIFDAHEYAPREFEDSFKWRFFVQRYNKAMCAKYIPKVDAMMTVCDGIAREYHKYYGVDPLVITNAPKYLDLKPSVNISDKIKIVHHGLANRSRKIELMIEAFNKLDHRFYMDFILLGDAGYINNLSKLVKDKSRVRFLPPVAMKDIPVRTNEYDIGLYLLPPTNFNNSMALPNKFFEFIQARLALAIGPSVEMKRIVEKYACGVVASDFKPDSLAREINSLSREKVNYFKAQANIAAKELCFERNAEQFLDLVSNVLV